MLDETEPEILFSLQLSQESSFLQEMKANTPTNKTQAV
jgi:hypothetical protein